MLDRALVGGQHINGEGCRQIGPLEEIEIVD
jgi:hypothetical protein